MSRDGLYSNYKKIWPLSEYSGKVRDLDPLRQAGQHSSCMFPVKPAVWPMFFCNYYLIFWLPPVAI
jgi:hypothetical protein